MALSSQSRWRTLGFVEATFVFLATVGFETWFEAWQRPVGLSNGKRGKDGKDRRSLGPVRKLGTALGYFLYKMVLKLPKQAKTDQT